MAIVIPCTAEWLGWAGGRLGLQALTGGASALILLAAAVLILRAFRERYLFFWILGWSTYLAYQLLLEQPGDALPAANLVAVIRASFILCVVFLAVAVMLYIQQRRKLTLVLSLGALALLLTLLNSWIWPHSAALTMAVECIYHGLTIGTALCILRFSWARSEPGLWLMAIMLALLQMDPSPGVPHALAGTEVAVEVLLGLSMLVVVLDNSNKRTQRLEVVNQITTAIAHAQNYEPVVVVALEELKQLMRARAAWFRLLEHDQLVIKHQTGLSNQFTANYRDTDISSDHGAMLIRAGEPLVLQHNYPDPMVRRGLQEEHLNHIIVLPVKGKSSVIGTLSLGCSYARTYRPEEMEFLAATANQLGIAMENLQLLDQIKRSQRQWVNTFDSISDPILVHDAEFKVIRTNRALLERVGKPINEVIYQPCEAVLPQNFAGWKKCPYCFTAKAASGDAPDPCFGGFSSVSTSVYTEEDAAAGTIHIIRDITERRVAEQRYRTLFEQVQEGVFVSTPDGRLMDCNDAFVRMMGYDRREEVLSLNIAPTFYLHPEDRDAFLRKTAEQGYVKNLEVPLRRKDGSKMTVLENSFATRDASGRIVRYQGVLLDITEKKRAEEEMSRRNRELHALNTIAVAANQSFDLDEILNIALRQVVDLFAADTGSVFLLDHESCTLRRCAAFGHTSELGQKLPNIELSQELLDTVMRTHLEVVTERQNLELCAVPRQFIIEEGLQSWLWVVMWAGDKMVGVLGVSSREPQHFSPFDEKLMVAISRQLANTTEKVRLYDETVHAYDNLRRTQEQLLQSEKMSAVGQLISGVAHELNNPLTAILGYAQLLEGEALEPRIRDYIEKMHKQAQRTQRIVHNLLSFARQRKPAKMPVDLCRVLEDTLALREYDLNVNNIVVIRNLDADLPPVVADAHQMEQVFLNIINNAVDAILEKCKGGHLEVRVHREGAQVSAEFRDSGPGIREVNRIFDPFYTTKSIGKGTGLGLSICYGIVKEHGGDIRAYNHPQGGAVVEVKLPVAAAEPKADETHAAAHVVPLRGRVLIIDDEEAVLDFEQEVLKGAGAEVVVFDNGREAVARLREESFDAVLLDSSMPGGWSGPDVYRWIRANAPQLKDRVIFTVSNLTDPTIRNFLDENGILYISKPFEVTDLIALIRQILQHVRANEPEEPAKAPAGT